MPQIKTTAKPFELLSDIRKRPWFVHDYESLLPRALAFLRGEPSVNTILLPEAYEYFEEPSTLVPPEESAPHLVAVIPIIGFIPKYDSWYAYGATTYASAIRQAVEEPNVCGIVLDIDSGGGACNAIQVLKEAIAYARDSGKPIIAHVDMCASLAYWMSSQCDAIFCDNSMSEVGSIGALCYFADDTGALEKDGYKVISVYADESPDKNLSYRKALQDDYGPLKQELSFSVGEFHRDVKAGRPGIKADAPGVFTGAMFHPTQALEMGMIDGMATLAESIENVVIRAQ